MNNAKALDMEMNMLRDLQSDVLKKRDKLGFLLEEDIIDLSTYNICRERFNAYYDKFSKDISTLSKQLFDLTKPQENGRANQ